MGSMDEYRRSHISKMPGFRKNQVIKVFREKRWPSVHQVGKNSKFIDQNKKSGEINLEIPMKNFKKEAKLSTIEFQINEND